MRENDVSLRVLIVDDEAPARRKVRSHLSGKAGVEIAGEAANGLEAVDAIRRLRPDLVFLDIQMPGMNGFEVIGAVGVDVMPAVVFVTAFDEFALDAFDVEAVDYLLKPIREDRFERAWKRAMERVDAREGDRDRLARLLEHIRPAARHLQRIVVRDGERLFFVPTSRIVRVSADGNYVKLHTADGFHVIRETIARLESRLDPDQFARIHRSEIVNIDYVQEIQPWFHGDHVLILKNGEERRLSRRYKARLLRDQSR
jgi:two-component system LytT family response regulator